LVRRLRSLVAAAGFADADLESHGYVETTPATYTPTVVDFGADALARDGVIDAETASALKEEARRRIESETFFGHMAYASLLASRPHDPEEFADPFTGVPPVLRRAIEAYNDRDADRLGACYAHDATFASPVVAVDGADQIANLWRAWFTAFPDVVSRLEHIVVDGATAIVRWTESGTHTGVLNVAGLDHPATGKRLEWHGTSTYRIDQSAIASVTYEFDSQALLAVIVADAPNT
jgi:predicted ester cyclase